MYLYFKVMTLFVWTFHFTLSILEKLLGKYFVTFNLMLKSIYNMVYIEYFEVRRVM